MCMKSGGNMKILICAPTSREYRAMRYALDNASGLKHNYDLVEVGIGKALSSAGVARALTLATEQYDMLAVVGFAASALGRKQGDIVMPCRAIHHDAIIPENFCPEITDPRMLRGTDPETVFTGDSFVNADIIREVKSRFGVECGLFDMEIAAICQVAELYNNIPVVVAKYVSDVPEEGHSEQSYEEFANAHSDFTPLLNRLEAL
jgi:nucleoside phosphorylase